MVYKLTGLDKKTVRQIADEFLRAPSDETAFDLSGNHLGARDPEEVKAILALIPPRARLLSLGGNRLDLGLNPELFLAISAPITSLCLAWQGFCFGHGVSRRQVIFPRGLNFLSLNMNDFNSLTKGQSTSLLAGIAASKVHNLSLNACELGGYDEEEEDAIVLVDVIGILCANRRIKTLNLSSNNLHRLTQEALNTAFQAITAGGVTSLALGSNNPEDDEVATEAFVRRLAEALPLLQGIKELDLSCAYLKEWLPLILQCLPKSVKSLNLCYNDLNYLPISTLDSISGGCSQIRTLYLSADEVDDDADLNEDEEDDEIDKALIQRARRQSIASVFPNLRETYVVKGFSRTMGTEAQQEQAKLAASLGFPARRFSERRDLARFFAARVADAGGQQGLGDSGEPDDKRRRLLSDDDSSPAP